MATLNDTALGTNDASGTSLATSDALTVTAGDLIVVGFKREGATTSASCSDGTNSYSACNASYEHANGDLGGVVFYTTAAASGTISPQVTLGAARTFRKIKAYSFTPTSGTTLQFENANVAEDSALSTTTNTGNASIGAAGVAVAFFHAYGTRSLTAGSGWSEAAEFNISDAQLSEYRLPSGSGTFNGDGTLDSTVDYIGQIATFKEVAVGGGGTEIIFTGSF